MNPADVQPELDLVLPILDYRQAILSSVDANQVTIITAETGAGKSTQVPQYLAEHGFAKVIVTQPRILAARTLAMRVREEVAARTGLEESDYVGYRTSYERDDSPETVILYCTDGLQLVREITGSGISQRQILLLDEVHEWNENMEVLIAWAKKRCQEDSHFKVVIMSATIEANNLAQYFGGGVPIVVPGRSYAITKRRADDLIGEVERQLKIGGKNMLVFLPGKAEIENAAEYLAKIAEPKGIPIIPLHSQLEAADQQKAFGSYPNGKVVLATNIAQTSVTIEDIDLVIDSGLQRQTEVCDGVEGLFMAQVSQADCLQRAGRAGRTKDGEYVLAPFERMPCTKLEDRPSYAMPEILRKHLDRLVLRLANVDIDMADLEFYHAPSSDAIAQAKRKLIDLGAMTQAGQVTEIGKKMERFPVESSFARMLVEARQYGKDLQAKLAAIIAIQEVGGIVKGGSRFRGWRQFVHQYESDLVAHYEVFLALDQTDAGEWEELGIVARNVDKAREVLERLNRDLGLESEILTGLDDRESSMLRRCIAAGQIDQVWLTGQGGAVHIASQQQRELSGGTVISGPTLVVGTPFDLQIPTLQGLEVRMLLQDVTAIDPVWLQSLAPEVFRVHSGATYFDEGRGALAMRWQIELSDGSHIDGVSTAVLERSERTYRLFIDSYAHWLHDRLEMQRRHLQKASRRHIGAVPLEAVRERVAPIIGKAICMGDLSKRQLAELARLTDVRAYLNPVSATHSKGSHGRNQPQSNGLSGRGSRRRKR